jgi:integrase
VIDGVPVWRVPPARMKLARQKKDEASFAHLVPLSDAAMAALRSAAVENGYDTHSAPAAGLVFAGWRGSGPLSERAIGDLYARAGYAGRHVPHGWRASFSTIMNELMPAERDAIDLALAHAGKGKVEGAYNRAQLLGRRRALFDRWAQLLANT